MTRPLTGDSLAAFLERSQNRVAVSRELLRRSRLHVRTSGEAAQRSRILLSRVELLPLGPPAVAETHPVSTAGKQAETRPAAGTPNLFENVIGRAFHKEVVSMDGRHFVDCTVDHCVLRYSGQPMILESTSFEACTFEFAGEAALTAQFLECFGMMAERASDYTILHGPPRTSKPN